MLFWPFAPAHQLEVGVGQGRACVFAGCHRGGVTTQNTGLGPPEHLTPSLGLSE
jgi:hypothetical protein